VTPPSRRTLLAAAAAAVGLGGAIAAVLFWQAAQERRALAAYAEILPRVQAAQGAPASPEAKGAAMRDLEAALHRYPSAPTAAQAAYQLANLRYDARQYAAARAAYAIAAARAVGPTIRTLAQVGTAAAWEADRDYPRAAEALQTALVGLGPRDFLYEDLLIDLGRIQELKGSRADAVETYRRLLKDLPNSRQAEEIRRRLGALGADTR
jgi:tetratricopeptide (TPR) repeat protein